MQNSSFKNRRYTIEITGFTAEGMGVGRADGKAVFVPDTAVGDVVDILVVSDKKQYCYGKVMHIITPSPDRVRPDCGIFSQCGGCTLRHLTYKAELRLKETAVGDAVKRIGGLNVPIRAIIPSAETARYRCKAAMPAAEKPDGSLGFGFYAPRSHRVVFHDDCLLAPAEFSKIASVTADLLTAYGIPPYHEMDGTGLVRHLFLRKSVSTGNIMLCLVLNGDKMPHEKEFAGTMAEKFPKIAGILINCNRTRGNRILGQEYRTLYGTKMLTETLLGVEFTVSPSSFFQVNPPAAELLYTAAAEAAEPDGKHLLDLYCGTGSIGLTMARRALSLTGAEIVPEAVENATENARRAGIENARFLCADAGTAADHLLSEGLSPDVVIVDPPRAGCDAHTLDAIIRMDPERIIMVSCNPATMARDLKLLSERGFKPLYIQPVDMFPRTAHVESVALITRAAT